MQGKNVTMVRVYLTEGEGQLNAMIKRLHDWEKVRGVTVFRGIIGFGPSGVMHAAGLIDLSMDLPIVVEFFDEPDKVREILDHIADQLQPGHVVTWSATVNE